MTDLGWSTGEIPYDRMRTMCVREDPAADHIIYNRTLVELARHCGYLPRACRPCRAKARGRVGCPFRCVREDVFLARSLRDLDDRLRQWLDGVANPRTHATTRRVVLEHLAEEQPSLRPLPARPFRAVLRLGRRITGDGMIPVDGDLYSVPDTTRRRPVEVHGVAGVVRILEEGPSSPSIPCWTAVASVP